MKHDEMISVIQAHKEGKKIEYRRIGCNRWISSNPNWDFPRLEYRVKPDPREIWVNEYPNEGSIFAHPSKEAADQEMGNRAIAQIRFVEVERVEVAK